jgi:hypothetical protein
LAFRYHLVLSSDNKNDYKFRQDIKIVTGDDFDNATLVKSPILIYRIKTMTSTLDITPNLSSGRVDVMDTADMVNLLS